MVTHWTSCVSCLYHGSFNDFQLAEVLGCRGLRPPVCPSCQSNMTPSFGPSLGTTSYYHVEFLCWTSHENTLGSGKRCKKWWPVDSLWTRLQSFGSPAPVNCQLVAEEEIEEVMKVPYATNQPTRQPGNPPTPKQENRKTGPLVYMSKLQLRDGRDRKCMDQTPESSAQLLSQSVSVAWFAYMFAYVWM